MQHSYKSTRRSMIGSLQYNTQNQLVQNIYSQLELNNREFNTNLEQIKQQLSAIDAFIQVNRINPNAAFQVGQLQLQRLDNVRKKLAVFETDQQLYSSKITTGAQLVTKALEKLQSLQEQLVGLPSPGDFAKAIQYNKDIIQLIKKQQEEQKYLQEQLQFENDKLNAKKATLLEQYAQLDDTFQSLSKELSELKEEADKRDELLYMQNNNIELMEKLLNSLNSEVIRKKIIETALEIEEERKDLELKDLELDFQAMVPELQGMGAKK